jgi:hypothetical protein
VDECSGCYGGHEEVDREKVQRVVRRRQPPRRRQQEQHGPDGPYRDELRRPGTGPLLRCAHEARGGAGGEHHRPCVRAPQRLLEEDRQAAEHSRRGVRGRRVAPERADERGAGEEAQGHREERGVRRVEIPGRAPPDHDGEECAEHRERAADHRPAQHVGEHDGEGLQARQHQPYRHDAAVERAQDEPRQHEDTDPVGVREILVGDLPGRHAGAVVQDEPLVPELEAADERQPEVPHGEREQRHHDRDVEPVHSGPCAAGSPHEGASYSMWAGARSAAGSGDAFA